MQVLQEEVDTLKYSPETAQGKALMVQMQKLRAENKTLRDATTEAQRARAQALQTRRLLDQVSSDHRALQDHVQHLNRQLERAQASQGVR